MELQALLDTISSGDPRSLRDGSLFRSIRGLQSKIRLINSPAALIALSSFIKQDSTANAALRAVAQAAANTDGLEASKQSEDICWQIAQVPGLLKAVVARMPNDVDAVRLINNLAANSCQAAMLFSNISGSISALKIAAVTFRLHAFGVINHLSRFSCIALAMVKAGFIEEILAPAVQLREEDQPDDLDKEATLARATLALANLYAHAQGHCPDIDRRALEKVVKVLQFSVRGETLATITWLPTTVLIGTGNLALNEGNARCLIDAGIAEPISSILTHWEPTAGVGPLQLALRTAEGLVKVEDRFDELWRAGLMQAARSACESEVESVRVLAEGIVQTMERRVLAVCMGHNWRLGQGSPLMMVDHAVLYMIISTAFPPPPIPPAPRHAGSGGLIRRP